MFTWFRSLSLSVRILGLVGILLALIVVPNNLVNLSKFRGQIEKSQLHEAAAFTAAAETSKNEAARIFASGAFDMETLQAEVAQTLATGGDFHDTRLFQVIPVISAWHAAEEAAARENLDFKVRAFEARNGDNEPEAGSVEEQVLLDLTSRFVAGERTAWAKDDVHNELVFMRAIELDQSCMTCHGQPGGPYDPDGDGLDILGYDMEGWKPGDMHGAWTVHIPLDKIDATIAGFGRDTLWMVVPLCIGGFLLFGWFLRRVFSRPIHRVVEGLGEVAQGKLATRVEISGRDELGSMAESLNGFLEVLDDSFVQISSGSAQIDAGSAQLASASQGLATGTADQASSLEEISASLEEMSSMTEQNSEHAQEANRLTESTADSANRGAEEMERMSKAVDDIKASSMEISKVIKVIDDIAFQTNLLALNAAVEAARAGEAGKGFAVVAEEVRSLAQRSAEAAKETATLIEESTRRSDAGVEISERVAQVLGQVVGSVNQVNSLVGEIASASKEQAVGISQVNAGVTNLERVVQQNAASAEELASTSEETSSQVVLVKEMIERFEVSERSAASLAVQGRDAAVLAAPAVKPAMSSDTGLFEAESAPAPVAAPFAGIPMTEEEEDSFGDSFGDAAFADDDDLASF